MYSGDDFYDDDVTSGLLDYQPRKKDTMTTTTTAKCGGDYEHGAHAYSSHGYAQASWCAGNLDPVAAVDGCPECGRDIDRLGGNPDCEICAAEPKAERLVDIGFVVSVNEVPEHLVDLVTAYLGISLDSLVEDILGGLDESSILVHGKSVDDLSDEDRFEIAALSANVSEMVR